MKNFYCHPKTVIIKGIDPKAIETISDSAMRVFFSKVTTLLTDIFSWPEDDEDSDDIGHSYSSASIPLCLEKMISDESVFRYIYANWDLWIRLTHKTALFYNTCLKLFADHAEWLEQTINIIRTACNTEAVKDEMERAFGIRRSFAEMLLNMSLSELSGLTQQSCIDLFRYWSDLENKLIKLSVDRY